MLARDLRAVLAVTLLGVYQLGDFPTFHSPKPLTSDDRRLKPRSSLARGALQLRRERAHLIARQRGEVRGREVAAKARAQRGIRGGCGIGRGVGRGVGVGGWRGGATRLLAPSVAVLRPLSPRHLR